MRTDVSLSLFIGDPPVPAVNRFVLACGVFTGCARRRPFDSSCQNEQQSFMTIELPDIPAGEPLTPQEVRLELACALYARRRIGKVAAAQLERLVQISPPQRHSP